MMNKEKILSAFNRLPSSIKRAEFSKEAHKSYSFLINENRIRSIAYSDSEEYFVRTRSDKEGYYYTQDGNEDPLTLFLKADENSAVASYMTGFDYNRDHIESEKGDPLPDIEVLKEKAFSLYTSLKEKTDSGILEIELIAQTVSYAVINNLGLDVSYDFPLYLLIATLNKEDGSVFVRNDIVLKDLSDDLDEFINDLNHRYAYQELPLCSFQSGEYPVLLDQNFVYILMCTAWQLFSGKKYLEKGSPFAGKLGNTIATDVLNLYDDCTEGYRYRYDCEGTFCENIDIVKNGVFTHPFLNLDTAEKLNAFNNGSAGRKPLLFGNIATEVQITPRNFRMKKGRDGFDKLLEKMDDGILIVEHYDIFHSLNIASGDFAIPCSGVRVKNGKIVGSLKALVLNGNISDLFQNLIAVSNRQTLRPMHYLNNYGIASCDMLISKMKVYGE